METWSDEIFQCLTQRPQIEKINLNLECFLEPCKMDHPKAEEKALTYVDALKFLTLENTDERLKSFPGVSSHVRKKLPVSKMDEQGATQKGGWALQSALPCIAGW